MVIHIGRSAGAGERPELEQAVVDEVEGLGLVAKAVFAAGLVGIFGFRAAAFGYIGIGAGLVGAGVMDVGRLGVARGGEAAVLPASFGVAGAAFLAFFSRRARALSGGEGTGWRLVDAFLVQRASINWQSVDRLTPRCGPSPGKVEWVGIRP
jgi:hypothetical protein